MTSAVATVHSNPTSPLPNTPHKRAKKKVRVQEVIPHDEPTKLVDTFHVQISNVRAVLRVSEARPVFLTFEFDSYWYAETDVWSENVEPVWSFNPASICGHDGRKPVSADGHHNPPLGGVIPEAKFIYETEFGYKLHRKFLIVKLAERSPYGDVEWGQGVVPLDSIARGCPATDISILAKDNLTCYGTVTCNITMANVQKVRAHLTDIKLSEYPEAYTYDVKLIYLEFGYTGFEAGYCKCTEKRSDGEPRFSAQPALEYDTSLRDMLMSRSGAPSLKIYFSVHRQVARNRTEEIGVGALPVRMLFSKVHEGWMDLPTKFKVPLANYKGVIRGKILLRNIPQFSQLPGDDLLNVDGNILPLEVDLTSRKLLPWLKLPKSRDQKMKVGNESHANDLGQKQTDPLAAPVGNASAHVGSNGGMVTAGNGNHVGGQYYSSMTESASDGGSESSVGSPRGRAGNRSNAMVVNSHEVDKRTGQRGRHGRSQNAPADASNAASVATSPLASPGQMYTAEADTNHVAGGEKEKVKRKGYGRVTQGRLRHEWMRGMTREEELGIEDDGDRVQEEVRSGERWERFADLRIDGGENGNHRELGAADMAGTTWGYEGKQWDAGHEGREYGDGLRERRNKSGKSVGSAGTADGGVEIGSVVLSTASDDGYATGSRTTTEDVMMISQRFSTGPPSEERYEVEPVDEKGLGEVGHGVMTMGDELIGGEGVGKGGAGGPDGFAEEAYGYEEDAEWTAILDRSSGRYFFAHRYTQESLWLPPEWERMEDEDGREYFVDHGSRTTQRDFPAVEARAYRESVYTAT
eukprot:GFKZ01010620.1.p1 GENE.GFKZ01010620.1~~GFKZ01010620.1.p1  ORF type:complete len:806 (-),score=109.94 GFKZ01010620.1:1184-3601(-)